MAAILLWFARSGLVVYFTGDDMMNAYFAWQKSYGRILLENIFYFTPGYRPMGTLVYRLLYDTAGMNALPYRIVCYLLVGSSRVDLQACKLEYSIVSPK